MEDEIYTKIRLGSHGVRTLVFSKSKWYKNRTIERKELDRERKNLTGSMSLEDWHIASHTSQLTLLIHNLLREVQHPKWN